MAIMPWHIKAAEQTREKVSSLEVPLVPKRSTTISLITAFRWTNKKWARWKLSFSSPMQPSLYHMLLVLLISSGLQEGDRSIPSMALCPGCTWSHSTQGRETSGPGAMRRTHATPRPGVTGKLSAWAEASCLLKTSDSWRRVARASKPQLLRRADNSPALPLQQFRPCQAPAGGWREPCRRFPVSCFFPAAVACCWVCHVFSVISWFLKRALPCYKRHARGTPAPALSLQGETSSIHGAEKGDGPQHSRRRLQISTFKSVHLSWVGLL